MMRGVAGAGETHKKFLRGSMGRVCKVNGAGPAGHEKSLRRTSLMYITPEY